MDRLKRWPFVYYWLPALLWMALIFAVSAQPNLPSVADSRLDTLFKKLAHMVEYAILTLLLWRALNARPRLIPPLWMAFICALFYAASDEFHQLFVPGRNGTVRDVLIDSIGIIATTIILWLKTHKQARTR